jgi:hypothetical protein
MNNSVVKASKGRRFGILAVIALFFSCIQPVFADGEYTIYNASTTTGGNDEYHATTATSLSEYDTSTDPLVYCINLHKSRPQPSVAGISGYTKTSQASDTAINSYIVNTENAKYVRAVLYYGYPNFGGGNSWKTTYESTGRSFPTTAYYWRVYTQAAIWYFTDSYSGLNSYDPGYTLCTLATQNADSVPSDFYVDLYTTTDGVSQNFIGLEAAETSVTTTSVSVKVNKTWVLSTSGTYDGTIPDTSFTLYEGSGTTGTSYGPLTLGEDGTVTFSSVDTTTEVTFTLVENISGTVTGYTFSPIENMTLDLSGTSDGGTYEVDVENTVTPETEEDSTEISVKVNKTWNLSTGGTYSGTKPEVTFTLYGGEGTTGTNYGTVTLGEDDTAVFENIDAGSYEKFTIVENINDTVSGYTFEPCDNIVVDISSLSSNNELDAEAVNEVTQEKVVNNEKNEVPDTGARGNTNIRLYLAVMTVGAIVTVSLRKHFVK